MEGPSASYVKLGGEEITGNGSEREKRGFLGFWFIATENQKEDTFRGTSAR